MVATYFHYNDIRLRWPHRLRHVRFVDIGPDPAIARELSGAGIARAWVFEHDPVTAATVAADLTPLLEESIEAFNDQDDACLDALAPTFAEATGS